MGRGQLDDHEQYDLIISRILMIGTAWDFVRAKCSLCYWMEKCGGLVWRCCPATFKEKQMKKNEEGFKKFQLVLIFKGQKASESQ